MSTPEKVGGKTQGIPSTSKSGGYVPLSTHGSTPMLENAYLRPFYSACDFDPNVGHNGLIFGKRSRFISRSAHSRLYNCKCLAQRVRFVPLFHPKLELTSWPPVTSKRRSKTSKRRSNWEWICQLLHTCQMKMIKEFCQYLLYIEHMTVYYVEYKNWYTLSRNKR